MRTGEFEVRYTDAARDELIRLFDFMLERAQTSEDFDDAQGALAALTATIETQLSRTPFIFRKAGTSPFVRELIAPWRSTGYVVLYEIEGAAIEGAATVNIVAVRHQLEDDYH